MAAVEQAREVATKLAQDVSPIAVMLFGSAARDGAGNDLDLLVITEHEGMCERVGESLREFYRRFAIDYFDAAQETITAEVRKGSPFLAAVQKEGRLLYMRDSLKEWVLLTREDMQQAEYLLEGAFYRGGPVLPPGRRSKRGSRRNCCKRAGNLSGFIIFAGCSV